MFCAISPASNYLSYLSLHHEYRYFVEKKFPELIMLNQNTFFAVNEISEEFKTRSTLYINYNHAKVKDEAIEIDGLSSSAFEEVNLLLLSNVAPYTQSLMFYLLFMCNCLEISVWVDEK